jgi:hypothetical protein
MQAARPVLRVGAAIIAAGARHAAAGARRSVTVQARRGVSFLAGAPARFKSSPRLNALQGITHIGAALEALCSVCADGS